jgi:hypothetical protein
VSLPYVLIFVALASLRHGGGSPVGPTMAGYELRHVDRMPVEEWVADLQASGPGIWISR